jgi:hypothetical protein
VSAKFVPLEHAAAPVPEERVVRRADDLRQAVAVEVARVDAAVVRGKRDRTQQGLLEERCARPPRDLQAGGVDRLRDEVAALVGLVRPQDLEGAGDVVPRGAIAVGGVDHDRERRLRPAILIAPETRVMPLGLLDAKARFPHAGDE